MLESIPDSKVFTEDTSRVQGTLEPITKGQSTNPPSLGRNMLISLHWKFYAIRLWVCTSVVTSHQQVESSHFTLWSSRVNVFTLESSQWLHSSRVNGYANCTVNKNASLQVEACLSTSRITFYFFKPLEDSSNPNLFNYNIFDEFIVNKL
jgi:hypothetical protein